jgi:molybdenum cofactor biosynthesis enzyme MoaA
MAVKVNVYALEFHITGRCNIRCKYCCAGSPVRIDEVQKSEVLCDIEKSTQYFNPEVVLIIGGETFLHPDWYEITAAAAQQYKCPVAVCTNGILVKKHLPELTALVKQYPNIYVRHSAYPFAAKTTAENLALLKQQGIVCKIVDEKYFEPIQIETLKYSNPQDAWECCICKYCRAIYRGQLYKCARMSDYAALQTAPMKNGLMVKQSYRDVFEQTITRINLYNTNIIAIKNMLDEEEVDACRFCNEIKQHVDHTLLTTDEYNTLLQTLTED